MEIEATKAADPAPARLGGIDADDGAFGTRPSNGRPHSLSLSGPVLGPTSGGAPHGLELLLGLGVGAAVMYYLDPDGGQRRRVLLRDQIARAVAASPETLDALLPSRGRAWTPSGTLAARAIGGALTLLAARRRDALGAAFALVGSALLADGVRDPRARRPVDGSEVLLKPVRGELGDAVQRPGLLEEV